MTTGASGTYAIQGTDLTLQPTEGGWVSRDSFGQGGGGHFIYSAVRSYELSWQLISQSDLSQIIGFYNVVSSTGTVAVDLPSWSDSTYQFRRYSGCVLSEPEVSKHFLDHTSDVRLLIVGIVTE